jgi:hypothetical protein
VKIRFNDAEYDVILARAAEARVSVQRYLVERAFTRTDSAHRVAPSAVTAELAAVRRLLANLANNMNQVARQLNSGADPDARIPAVSDAVSRASLRLDAVLTWLDNPPLRNGTGTGVPPRNDAPARRPAPSGNRNADPRQARPASPRPPTRSAADRHP